VILEGILTTINADSSVNIAPMGPLVDAAMRELVLRPFQTSTSYANLKRTGQGVFHVTDDVELLAHAAVGDVEPRPPLVPAGAIEGWILADCCRWFALRVRTLDDHEPRTRIVADVVDQGRQRDFFGFNRGKHAVLEAAILATRVHLLAAHEIARQMRELSVLVDKTGGQAELRAFRFLDSYIQAAAAGKLP
jgi:uncharacterized protein